MSYRVICKDAYGQYEYATKAYFNKIGAYRYLMTVALSKEPMVIKEDM